MYEQFKHQVIISLSSRFSLEDLKLISKSLDIAAYDYEFSKKETSVAIYNSELPEMAKTFLVCKKIEGLSEQTLYNYGIILKNFFFELQKSPEQINTNDIRVYLYRYQEQRKITNRSLDKIRQALCSFFQWASGEGYLQSNPMNTIKKIKYEKKQRTSLSQIELEYIRESCVTLKEKAIVEFLYSTGCRVSELAAVKENDIDWDKKTVILFGKGSKYRKSYLNAKAEFSLKKYLESRTDTNAYLFVSDRKPHNQMHKAGLEKIVREISKRITVDIGKDITPHIFRHTTATTAINNGMPFQEVSELLGHADISTTMIYAHTSTENVQSNHRKYVI